MEKYLKNKLTPVIWKGFEIKQPIRNRLLAIAKSFYEESGLNEKVKVKDIIIAGSSCNYNYHIGSDIDLHIVIKFSDINEDKELVKKYLKEMKDNWNKLHHIQIQGMDIEISLQDSDPSPGEELNSMGIYSLLDNVWLKRPDKKVVPPSVLEERNKIASELAKDVSSLETQYLLGDYDHEILYGQCKDTWKKIKELRKVGLKEGGEYDPYNLAFKKLRDDGFIEKIVDVKNNIYDKFFSKQ